MLIAVNEDLPCTVISNPTNLEVIAIKLCLQDKQVSICTVYNPPNPNIQYFENLINFLTSLVLQESNLIIIGDLNLPDICWPSLSGSSFLSNLFCDFVFDTNLTQLISGPTHVKGNTLDILLTNNECLVTQVSVLNSPSFLLSDHYQICFHIDNYSSSPKQYKSKLVFNFSNADFDGLSDFLLDLDLSWCLQSSSVERVWTHLKNSILKGMNLFIPKVKVKYKRYPCWFNSEIRHIIKCLRSARRNHSSPSKVHSLESYLSQLMVNAKLNFEHNLALQTSDKIFKHLRGLSSSRSIPSIVTLDSHTGSSDYEKASIFNKFFHSVFTKSAFQLPPIEDLHTPTPTLSDIGISELDVFEALSTLDTSKAMGIDSIGPKILKRCALALYKPLHHLFLLSLSQHSLPSDWRVHLIIPVFKSGDKSSVRNYRPISLLCSVSKILEKPIYDKIIPFVSTSISSCQFGFRPKHSSTQQLLSFLNTVHTILDTHSQADVVYLDFRKAFDSVPHNELLMKLWSFGLTGNLWKWFRSYLAGRSQCVLLNQCTSDLLPVISGVPQGSILGPLLFLIFVNDLPLSIRHSHIFLYADDTKCLKNVSSHSDSHSLQDDLSNLFSWSLQWNLHFNENKCVLLRLCPKHPRVLHDYTINGSPIQVLDCYRDLGILISSDLKWGNHLTMITARAYKVLGLIRRSFSNGLSISAKKRLYSSLVCSQLNYASQIWRPHLIKEIVALERVQRRASKFILSDYQSTYKHRLISLRILPLMMQFELHDILFFIRCLKEPDTSQAFQIRSFINFSKGNTRSTTYLKLNHSSSKTSAAAHFYFNRLPRLWNSLPPINLELSLQSIKRHLMQFYWNHFNINFQSTNPCTFHFLCPCAKCSGTSITTCFSSDTIS